MRAVGFWAPCALALALAAPPVCALQSATPSAGSGVEKPAPAAPETFIVLLRLRYDLFARWKASGKWPDDAQANAALKAHGEYWREQLRAGKALLAGGMKGDYWDNVALIIFEAASQVEAEKVVANDPAVRAYVFQAQVRPFDVSFVSEKRGTGQ